MNPRTKTTELLRSMGAVLARHRKHEVWKFQTGRIFVRAKTPSDCRSDQNNLRDLKRALDIKPEPKLDTPRSPRNKREHGGDGKKRKIDFGATTLGDALRACGVVEDRLREEIAALQARLNQSEQDKLRLTEQAARCWMCQLRRWWKQ